MSESAAKLRGGRRQDYKRKRVLGSNISLDWAKTNVFLTDRKIKILRVLEARPLLTIAQLEYFHPDFGHQSQSQLLLRRDINKLFEVYFVDKATKKRVVQWDGSVKRTEVVAMGRLGSEFVGWPTHYQRIRYEDGVGFLPKTAHHILRIHDMEIQTREFLKKLNIEVKVWVHECGELVVKHPNKINPDVFCMLHDHETNQYYTIFAEYDTGRADFGRRKKFPGLTQKINRYKEVKDWNIWYKQLISQSSENKFPYIFFVTEEPKRFPGMPNIFQNRGLDHTVCMQQDYLNELEKFIRKMRG